ncbi:MAG: hypothetical protein EXR78_06430 [Deltaproteobacteria bacterium]|nr:hypothetical protein [Deltaproteobacteria bacterium]
MTQITARRLSWIGRLIFVVVALWWPPVWRDQMYSPRYAQATGQELRLPEGGIPQTDDERAIAIFWRWEQRKLITTELIVGPYRGLFSHNPDGWTQTLIALALVLLVFQGILSYWAPPPPPEPSLKIAKNVFIGYCPLRCGTSGNADRKKRANSRICLFTPRHD